MTTINFSKTRIVYWSGTQDGIVQPSDLNSLPTGVDSVFGDINYNYAVYRIQANTHNWHTVPMNYYGLYCTDKELLCMFNNNSTIKPVAMNCIVGHCIPLNTTATGTSTSLSFNNTIYSLIHDIPPNDWVYPRPWGLQVTPSESEMITFFDTYDGGSKAVANTRLNLPKVDLLFKVPFTNRTQTDFPVQQQNITAASTAAQFDAQRPVITTMRDDQIYMTQNNLVNAYLPELLQVNERTKALYPGENQDMLNINIEDKGFATINTSAIRTNEFTINRDDRTYGFNTLAPFQRLRLMSVVPLVQGTSTAQYNTDNTTWTVATPYEAPVTDGFAGTETIQTFQLLFLREMIRHRNNDSELSNYNSLIPCKFVKCLPIIDGGETPISHVVCATVTWNLTVEVTMSLLHITNPYNTQHVNKEMIKTADFSTATPTIRRKEFYTQRWPLKYMDDTMMKETQRRYYAQYRDQNVPLNDQNPAWAHYTASAASDRFAPQEEFVSPRAYATNILHNHPTNVFDNVKSIRRSPRIAAKKLAVRDPSLGDKL